MSITYDELIKQVEDYSFRDDLTNKIKFFIQLAETEMYNNQNQPLTVRDMEVITTITTSAGRLIDLPDNYESARSIRLTVDGGELSYQSPERLKRVSGTGWPREFTVIGNQIEFNITPDSEYTLEIQYYARPDNLSEDNQTNSVLEKYPTIYLYGTLMQLFTHAQEDQQAQKYDGLFMNAIKGANKAQKRGRFVNSPSMLIDGGNIV